MITRFFILLFLFNLPGQSLGQKTTEPDHSSDDKTFVIGINLGIGWAYEDKAHLLNTSFGVTLDYHLKKHFYLQFAPRYSWLWKWNEHYLTLPIHVKKTFDNKLSIFAGPALSFDVGYFQSFGISAGLSYQWGKKSSIMLSAFSFTLHNYHIDYIYVPITLSYSYTF